MIENPLSVWPTCPSGLPFSLQSPCCHSDLVQPWPPPQSRQPRSFLRVHLFHPEHVTWQTSGSHDNYVALRHAHTCPLTMMAWCLLIRRWTLLRSFPAHRHTTPHTHTTAHAAGSLADRDTGLLIAAHQALLHCTLQAH